MSTTMHFQLIVMVMYLYLYSVGENGEGGIFG